MTKSVLSGRRDRKTRDLSVNKWGRGARLGDSVREILLGLPTYFISKPKKIPLPYIVKHANKFRLKKFDSHLIYIIFGQST